MGLVHALVVTNLPAVGGHQANALGAVVGGAGAQREDAVTAVVPVKGHRLRYIGSRGVSYGFVIDAVRNPGIFKRFFQAAGQSQLPDACISDDQDLTAFFSSE